MHEKLMFISDLCVLYCLCAVDMVKAAAISCFACLTCLLMSDNLYCVGGDVKHGSIQSSLGM